MKCPALMRKRIRDREEAEGHARREGVSDRQGKQKKMQLLY